MSHKTTLSKEEIYLTFDEISPTYDLINKILSLGIDKYWRRCVVKCIPSKISLKILDLATGTADQAISVLQRRDNVSLIGVDLSHTMIEIGEKKVKKKGFSNRMLFKIASACSLPFEDLTFDFITISFGIRNIDSLSHAMKEMHRVLKPGGTLLILEFSLPKNKLIRSLHLFYLKHILPKIGGLLSGNKNAYQYLNETIQSFPYGKGLCDLLKEEGFHHVQHKPLSFGIVTLYIASKDL